MLNYTRRRFTDAVLVTYSQASSGCMFRLVTSLATLLLLTIVPAGTIGAAVDLTDILVTGHDGKGCWGSSWCYTNPLLVRADKNGNVVWQVPIPIYGWTMIHGNVQIADRNVTEDSFYLSTYFDDSKVGGKHRILKFNKDGQLEWDLPFDPMPMVVSASPLLGGIYAISWGGNTLYRIGPGGAVIWSKTFTDPLREIAADIGTGGVYVLPRVAGTGTVIKLGPDGSLIWTRNLAPYEPQYLDANPLDGGVYVACDDYGHHSARLDRDGNVLWWLTDFPVVWPNGGTYGRGVDLVDGGFYIGAWYDKLGKVAPNGTPMWTITTPSYNGYLAAAVDGNAAYVAVGGAALTQKYSGAGALLWSKRIGPPSWVGGFYDTPGVHIGIPAPNRPPVANCRNVTASAGSACTLAASINNGSSDPDGDPITLVQSPTGPFGLGTTTVQLTVSDDHGASASCSAVVTVQDTTAPVLTVPAVVIANATSPAGALVTDAVLGASTSDNCCTPTITRTPSGNQFPIGSTTVNYVARDTAGNQTMAVQTVKVLGASDQAANLMVSVEQSAVEPGVRNSLLSKLDNALASIARNKGAACNQLSAFVNEVSAQAGKKIPAAQAQDWIAAVGRIRASLGC